MTAPSRAALPCLGAAALDLRHPCTNLTASFVPSLSQISSDPGVPCGPTRGAPDNVCTFGTPVGQARRQVALVGDSHALHWRPALDAVARAKRWRAFSIAGPGCFFSDATRLLPDGLREPCTEWYRSVRRWLARRPQISTVFVSQRTATHLAMPPGRSELNARVRGFRRAWASLPKTVTRVIVIRDSPQMPDGTFDCLQRAIDVGAELPGPACRVARAIAVSRDPAVVAVRRHPSRRYRYIDMTDYFCTATACDPVIGGVLVYSDPDHITASYSKTLGPFLLRKVDRLLPDR